ncbi:MAG: S8 family serine peptidase [Anaerolineales bacterium]|nr:S8 family serine peptidase [Anaerolineales bacterium]
MFRSVRLLHRTLLLLFVLVLSTALPAAATKGKAEAVPDQLVVGLSPLFTGTIDDINATYGTATLAELNQLIFLLLVPEDSSAGAIKDAMALDLRLEFAEPNFISESPEHSGQDVWAWGGQDSEPYAGQSALAQLNIVPAHELTRGAGSLVAVIDTGVQLDHPALASHLVPGLDLVDGDLEPADTGNNQDDDGDGLVDEAVGHGTHVAGIVQLVAPEAQIMPIRALDSDGRSDIFRVAMAIQYASESGADVINLSLGLGAKSVLLRDVIRQATRAGAVVVAAAGNLASDLEQYPAASQCALAVTAVGPENQRSDFANYGDWIDFVAPGEAIYSTFTGSSYAWWSGSSMAAPFVAGQAALLHSVNPDLNAREVTLLIASTAAAVDASNPAVPGQLGAGLPNVAASVAMLLSGALPTGNNGYMSGGCVATS